MLNTIKSYIEAAKARKEDGEKGFSLVELIVVVVILGILAAVAIPIFSGIQDQARTSATEAAAANVASEVAVQLATDKPAALPAEPTAPATAEFSYTFVDGTPTDIDKVCVEATNLDKSTIKAKKGPGC